MTKFQMIPLAASYNRKRDDARPWETATAEALAGLPVGERRFWGVPFDLGSSDGDASNLVVAGDGGSTAPVLIQAAGHASHVVVAHVCDSRARSSIAGQTADYSVPVVTAPGEHLADYVLVYADGSEAPIPIRRRFEINQVMTRMQSGFAARQHQDYAPLEFRGPYPANMWGRWQTGVTVGPVAAPPDARGYLASSSRPAGSWSIFAIPNPHPERELAGLRVESTGAAAIAIGGVTLFSGSGHPLRLRALESIAIEGASKEAPSVEVDMGVVARRCRIGGFDPDAWLTDPVKGWGGLAGAETTLVADVAAAEDATLMVDDAELSMADLHRAGEAVSGDGRVRVRTLTAQRTWVHGRIIDAATGRPTPARIHFRSADGRYFPPYGHSHEINDNWFEDYGADLKLGDTEYAYVDGTFQGELPVGEVYVEVAKGFEYEPIRQRIEIRPGQRELELRLERMTDLRSAGWVTADTHVHFLSPETAHLEAQAEGLNLLNLLAAQWGDLFTNVGDITGAASGSLRDDTIVWVGSENRQHFLGHLSMLGVQGEPVLPMSTSGPAEGYFGDPTERAMSEWADECRRKDGVVVVPHFPFPHSEVVAEVVRERVDGLEIRDFFTPTLDTFAVHEWYRLLNTGHRVAAVGGTDKMSAGMPVGGVRTYAHIGDEDFSFAAWGRAVRAGRTYTTSGPLLSLSVEGRSPGDEIKLPGGGGRILVEASMQSTMPVNRLEIVLNGRVVAEAAAKEGARSLTLSEEVHVQESGWLAARCISEHKAWHCWPVHFGAHTSPVYIAAGSDEVFDGSVGQYLITMMEGGLVWLDTLATPSTPERHAAIRGVFEDGIGRVRAKMARHGHAR